MSWLETLDFIPHRYAKVRQRGIDFWGAKPVGYHVAQVVADLAFEARLEEMEARKQLAMRRGDPRVPMAGGESACVVCRRRPQRRLNRCNACYMRQWRQHKNNSLRA